MKMLMSMLFVVLGLCAAVSTVARPATAEAAPSGSPFAGSYVGPIPVEGAPDVAYGWAIKIGGSGSVTAKPRSPTSSGGLSGKVTDAGTLSLDGGYSDFGSDGVMHSYVMHVEATLTVPADRLGLDVLTSAGVAVSWDYKPSNNKHNGGTPGLD
jgi:hypothetical protein